MVALFYPFCPLARFSFSLSHSGCIVLVRFTAFFNPCVPLLLERMQDKRIRNGQGRKERGRQNPNGERQKEEKNISFCTSDRTS